jgi:hypothetical protein
MGESAGGGSMGGEVGYSNMYAEPAFLDGWAVLSITVTHHTLEDIAKGPMISPKHAIELPVYCCFVLNTFGGKKMVVK